jgi:hypothetical protein
MTALKIAPDGGNRIGMAAGEQMKHRFFFDGIDIFCNQSSIDQTEQPTFPVFPYPASAPFSRLYPAMVMT